MKINSKFSGRALVFQFVSAMDIQNSEEVVVKLNGALQSWNSHGEAVEFEVEVYSKRIVVVVCANQDRFEVSGCSKDQFSKLTQDVFTSVGVEMVDPSKFVLEFAGEILVMSYDELACRAKDESWVKEVCIISRSVSTLKEANHTWLQPLKDSFVFNRMSSNL